MKKIHRHLAIGAMTIGIVLHLAATHADEETEASHAVFVMTNSAGANEVVAYERTSYGTLQNPRRYGTGGRGSGGNVDPLASQGSLTLSTDLSWLFAVNAGSGTLSVFHVAGSGLRLSDHIRTDGSEPNSVTQHGNLVYVLNTAGSSGVVGFHFEHGELSRIRDSLRFLSANAIASGSVAFSPDGRFLLVTEKATNSIDVFRVLEDGTLSPININADVGPGTFSATFAPSGVAIVAEVGPPGPKGAAIPNASGISSYSVQSDGTLKVISSSVPTLGTATCWSVVADNGRFVYTSNAGSSSISGFAIGSRGVLTPIPGTVVATNPTGSTNIDIAVSADGRFLYSLNAADGSIGMFAIESAHGDLTNLGVLTGLPASQGLNGIAAN